tara:strand:+ start:1072 stop:1782 length:711 start_codon:yes stop_codon:yes gene_type:complete
MISKYIKNIIQKNNISTNFVDISNLQLKQKPSDIFIIGNGASLNNINPKQLAGEFTIGTNRSWLWSNTNILIWRDSRITEEINFFEVEKSMESIWVCSADKSFNKEKLVNYNYTNDLIDYTFHDKWIKKILQTNIKWNGIIFHAIALAKHISSNATIHLIGIDLKTEENNHHFFNNISGFNQGFYRQKWNKNNFNYQKRLNMMYDNFVLLQSNGYNFKNYSSRSKLNELFGLEKLT